MKIPRKITPKIVEPEVVIASAAHDAQAFVACGMGGVPSMSEEVPEGVGASFVIPVLIPEETETGDSREFKYQSLTSRDFPLPLYWQIMTDEGHKSSVIVGRIDYAERIGEDAAPEPHDEAESVGEIIENIDDDEIAHATPLRGWGNAYGVFDTGPFGREAERLVRGGFLRGVSADLDKFEAALEMAADDEEEIDGQIKNDKMTVTHARLMGGTLLGKPAFQECVIQLSEEPELEVLPIEDGMYEDAVDDPEFFEASLVASAAPVVPPRDWFSNPGLKTLTPITVTDEGKVFGHIASWSSSHIGYQKKTAPPRSRSNYAYFRTGVLRTEDGSDVPVGQLTLAGGHAGHTLSAAQAVEHYDNTKSAVADVSAGEDSYGIWVSGSLRPDVTALQVRSLRASAPSGDWRPINGKLELVAVCQVNVPGFPVARAMVAGGQTVALTAAGARPIAEIRKSEVEVIADRLNTLEQKEFEERRAAAFASLAPLRKERDEALVASASQAKQALSALVEERNSRLQAQADAARRRFLGN